MSEHTEERTVPVSTSVDDLRLPSRRRLLQAAVAAGGVVALGDLGLAQEAETIELGGETGGWQGVAPAEIEGEENPTLELEEGTTYELTWENLDGQPHNIVIESDDGEELERTDLLTGEGETQTLEFEATSEMAEYYCEPHAGTMRGDIVVGDEPAPAAAEEEPDEEPEEFFEPGAEIGLETVAEGMTAPTDFAAVGETQYLVADQTGELWVVDDPGVREEPFLDVGDRMVELGTFEGDYADPDQDYDERGLLGVEPHPNFAENGRLFVHYSAPPNEETPEGWSHVEVVSEFEVEDDFGRADPDSERIVMTFQKPQYNHDAGPLAFGPDGYLYVPMGDGGGANDDMEGHVDDWYDENDGGNGQDVSENLLGGIHRIDVDGAATDDQAGDVADGAAADEEAPDGESADEAAADEEAPDDEIADEEAPDGATEDVANGAGADEDGGDRPYDIPPDNPLVDEEGALDEYYAWGFRNPYGISFDSQGRLFAADAGQDLFEEANLVERGGNYGWNVKEGTHCFSTESPSNPPEVCPDAAPDEPPYYGQELQDPIVEYPHVYEGEMVGIVIVGGHVYEAGAVEDLDGKYIFGDWTSDPSREEPAGRLLAAQEPTDDETGAGVTDDELADGPTEGPDDEMDGVGGDQEAEEEAIEDTQDEPIEDDGDDDGTEDEDVALDDDDGVEDDEDGDVPEEMDPDIEDEEVVPRDELWEMEELQVAGTEDGSFPYFVRMFGQDDQGNVYVLANREGVPEGDTGAVMRIVPPGEGEALDVGETAEADDPEPEAEATDDTQDEPIEDDGDDDGGAGDD